MIRIVSYNIHGGIGTDGIQSYERIGNWLKARRIDIALLQEFDTRNESRESTDDINALCGDYFRQLLPSPTMTTPAGWYVTGAQHTQRLATH